MKSVFLSSLALGAAVAAAHGQSFRTDINPALLYYQAFQVAPHLDHDLDYLYTNEWRVPHLDARFGELTSQFDNEFRLVRQAA
jgi:hypothetical protein